MRLTSARVQKYRSIRDTGWFGVEDGKTILVGVNEAGKTAILQALQQINPPAGVPTFDVLRDYPRSEYNDVTTGAVDPSTVEVVAARFLLDPDDAAKLPVEFRDCTYVCSTYMDNHFVSDIDGGPERPVVDAELIKNLARMAAHAEERYSGDKESAPKKTLDAITAGWEGDRFLSVEQANALRTWLEGIVALVDESNADEEARYDRLVATARLPADREAAISALAKRRPLFVLFNNYIRVRPLIHLAHLATRLETGMLDDDQYDYGNQCLLKLLGFSARELSDLGNAAEPLASDATGLKEFRDQLDQRSYQLNAASVRLTQEVREVWNPDLDRGEADRLRVQADGQYLKVVVEDEIGVEIELDQRSEGFQWLVSFFIVFFAEAMDTYSNAILLLDEPGLSLHGLKQREFRSTISKLAAKNQTIYTTHSPFLVGPGELDLVRVVEMKDRTVGTIVHTTINATDPASLLPLQDALGYDLAESLFGQERNLVLESLTDYWYLEATAQLLRDDDLIGLDNAITLVPAEGSGKVVYYATILYANNLNVAALLDSDLEGKRATQQDALIHTLGNKRIVRTKDAYRGPVPRPEIEDLLRDTLVLVAKELAWDVSGMATAEPDKPIVEIFAQVVPSFTKYRLAKAYLRWTRTHFAEDLTEVERAQWSTLLAAINNAFD